MKTLIASALVLGSITAAGIPEAHAGCLTGAAAGAVAGHVAGHHGVLGAVGGCAVGHHMAKNSKQQGEGAAYQQGVHDGDVTGPQAR